MHVKYSAIINRTRFLALDKCIKGRDFLQVIDIDAPLNENILRYDAEWLSIIKTMAPYQSSKKFSEVLPNITQLLLYIHILLQSFMRYREKKTNFERINDFFWENEHLQRIPKNFEPTRKAFPENEETPQPFVLNPQTIQLAALLETVRPTDKSVGLTSNKI
jgi:hypothetical protein